MVLGGTTVPLPNSQNVKNITVDPTDTVFTITLSGRYYLSYKVNTTAALLLGARLTVNGTPLEASETNPVLSVSSFNADIIVSLDVGDTISLELFGLLGAATLQDGQGATLTIIRIDDELV